VRRARLGGLRRESFAEGATPVAGVSCQAVDDAPSSLASLGYHWLSTRGPRHRQ